MKNPIILAYHLIAGLSDTCTGALLIVAPAFTLRTMQLETPLDALPFLSFIGAFVLAVGLAYLYGASLVRRGGCSSRLEAVWLVTAIIRASVATFVTSSVIGGAIPSGWLTIAYFDGACVLIQAIGLRRGWLLNVE